jgi:hypothetical protein
MDDVLGHPVTCTRTLTGRQHSNLFKAQCHTSAISLGRSASLTTGFAVFISNNTPIIGNFVDYSQKVCTCLPKMQINPQHPVSVPYANLQTQACHIRDKQRLWIDCTGEAGQCRLGDVQKFL